MTISSKVFFTGSGLIFLAASALPAGGFAATNTTDTPNTSATNAASMSHASPSNVTAQELNQNISSYVGKQVALTGRIDRVLGNGAYVVTDALGSKDSSHRIVVFTSNSSQMGTSAKQGAGIAAPSFKDGDSVQLSGKAEQFSISNEVDTFSPKLDTETVDETAETLPVVIIQSGNLKKRS
jgi:hypothetical protein